MSTELLFIGVGILAVIAILDIMVGVSNDAVNFLNSSIGSRVASRRTIMIIASLGIMAGVTFSSGMMEVALKFSPPVLYHAGTFDGFSGGDDHRHHPSGPVQYLRSAHLHHRVGGF
ncbi:MAG: hypothetical protein R2864_08950 [Syntrophotaleaceae bacterium]